MRPASRWTGFGVAAFALASVMVVGSGIAFTEDGRTAAPAAPGTAGATVSAGQNWRAADVGSAVTALQQRLHRLPRDYTAWAALGGAYVEQARVTKDPAYYAKAQGALDRSLRVRPQGNDAALTNLASLAAARHDFAEALLLAERAQRINPYSAANQGVMTDALVELGRYDEAWTELQRMVDLRPSVASLTRVSYSWELRGDLGRARQALKRARDMAVRRPDSAWVLYHLGELAWREGELDGAARLYREALKVEPDHIASLAGIAKVAAARGETETALDGYERVVRRRPTPAYVRAYVDLLTASGREQEAEQQRAVLEATQALFEDAGVDVGLDLALFHADHGRPQEALKAAESVYTQRRSVRSEDAYAWALHVNGRDSEALPHARAAASLGTPSAPFAYHRGMIENSLGMAEAATSSLQRALEINRRFSPLLAPRAERALARLERS